MISSRLDPSFPVAATYKLRRFSPNRWSISMTKTTAKGKGESPTNSGRMRKIGFRFTYSLNHSSDGTMRMNISGSVALTADLDKPLRDVAFAAAGTAGQRCTTLRRLFERDYDAFVPRLKYAYVCIDIGNPLHTCTLI